VKFDINPVKCMLDGCKKIGMKWSVSNKTFVLNVE